MCNVRKPEWYCFYCICICYCLVCFQQKPIGILMHEESYVLPITVKPGDTLDVLVENVGKVFYEPGLDPNQKASHCVLER